MQNISTQNGAIIDGYGNYSNILLYQRGFYSHIMLGYALTFNDMNNTGIYLSTGIGFLQHKIKIETRRQYLPNLSEDYKKGYDRLTNGISGKLALDYKYFNKKGRFQFFSGIEIIYGMTKNRRVYLFDTMQFSDNGFRKDFILGFSSGIIILINKRN